MKFTYGYILGSVTVAAIGASFVAGAYAVLRLEDSKDAALEEIKQMSVLGLVRTAGFGKKK